MTALGKKLRINIPVGAYEYLEWLARNGVLGVDAEDVARFLLIHECENLFRSGYAEKVLAFKRLVGRRAS